MGQALSRVPPTESDQECMERSTEVPPPAKHLSRLRWTAFFLVACFGLVLRLPELGTRPMHTDEAVNAYIVGELLASERYTYDPHDRHGPSLPALALPLVRLQGAKTFADLSETQLRLTTVLAGTATILLFGAASEVFGFAPSLIAALLFAATPLPLYYDRYFIHESLFITATLGLIVFGWRACTRSSLWDAIFAAIFAGLLLTSKETSLIHFAAFTVAALCLCPWKLRGRFAACLPQPSALITSMAVFVLFSILLFTWFGRNWGAMPELLRAVPNYLARASGEGHQKPFWYYFRLLTVGWSGGAMLTLACVGLVCSVTTRRTASLALIGYYAAFVAAIYSIIPYKTPWLALNLWLPIAILAGRACEWLWRRARKRLRLRIAIPVFASATALAAVLIAHDVQQFVFLHPAEETNPFAYAQTSEDLLGLPTEIADWAQHNNLSNPRISVIAADPWPLPWYLRRFSRVGFWQPGQAVERSDFYITSTEAAEQYKDQLRGFRQDFFGSRPGVLVLLWLPEAK